ncbi:MAG: DUF3313 domain-containing protein [Luteolibacter sp.]|uniref:DUF3313 domain-containing protein n=1 Tax=Luteolibacter sp. TaxID=1962973 RepID=UPI0032653601
MNLITRLGIFATAGAALALSSCSTGGKSPSGFLSNYKQMDGGYGTADAVSAYVKPGVDLKKYDSVIIDPVTTVVSSPGIDSKVTDQLAAYLGDSLRKQVVGELKVVSVPGPTTLRIRTALTDVIEGQTGGKAVTTVHPGARATLTGTVGSAEVAAFISKVSFEGEILDSVSGERLLANIDHRVGAKREASATTSWASVRSAVNAGVERLNTRFKTLRAR